MAKPPLDAWELETMLKERYWGATNLHPLVEGEESRAFAFDTAEGAFVVRINESAAGFEKDRFAFERFSRPGLPIPEVTLIAPIGSGSHMCVSRQLEGETLQALSRGGAYAYGGAVDRLLSTLSGIDPGSISGFGPFDAAGAGRFGTWQDYLIAPAGWEWDGLLAPDRYRQVRDAADAMCRMALQLPSRRGIVHGDFGSNNVLVAGGGISGLLDWSEAMVGDPLYDTANILFWRPWLDCMEQQCRYFEAENPERLAERQALTCYQLRIGLETLHEALAEAERPMADWALDRCQELLGAA